MLHSHDASGLRGAHAAGALTNFFRAQRRAIHRAKLAGEGAAAASAAASADAAAAAAPSELRPSEPADELDRLPVPSLLHRGRPSAAVPGLEPVGLHALTVPPGVMERSAAR